MRLFNSLLGILFGVIEYIFQTLCDFALAAVPSKRKRSYNADFSAPEKVLGKRQGGWTISNWSNTVKESHEHLLCTGGSGSHKSTAVAFPTLLCAGNVSFIVFDPCPELIQAARNSEKMGAEVEVIDLNHPERSEGINLLSKCASDTDANRIAHSLMRNASHSTDDFFDKSAENLISLFIRYLIKYARPEEAHLRNVLEMVNIYSYAPEKIDTLFVTTSLLNEFKAFAATPEKTLQCILSTARTSLSIFGSDCISKITSFDTIDFNSYRKQKKVLFICTSAADAHLYKGITATFFEMFWAHLLRTPLEDGDLPIYFLVEECASLYISSLASAVSLLRKKAVSIGLFLQDFSQLEHLYGKEATTIYANLALKVIMPGNKPIETCRLLETTLGKFHFDDGEGQKTRELLTAQEIRQLKEILVLFRNNSPMLLPVVPYFNQPRLRNLITRQSFIPVTKLPFNTPPIIQI